MQRFFEQEGVERAKPRFPGAAWMPAPIAGRPIAFNALFWCRGSVLPFNLTGGA